MGVDLMLVRKARLALLVGGSPTMKSIARTTCLSFFDKCRASAESRGDLLSGTLESQVETTTAQPAPDTSRDATDATF
jgi:hypothetical protein